MSSATKAQAPATSSRISRRATKAVASRASSPTTSAYASRWRRITGTSRPISARTGGDPAEARWSAAPGDDETNDDAYRRGDADRRPGILVHVLVGRFRGVLGAAAHRGHACARGGLGALERVLHLGADMCDLLVVDIGDLLHEVLHVCHEPVPFVPTRIAAVLRGAANSSPRSLTPLPRTLKLSHFDSPFRFDPSMAPGNGGRRAPRPSGAPAEADEKCDHRADQEQHEQDLGDPGRAGGDAG